jgi:hypothetical protein
VRVVLLVLVVIGALALPASGVTSDLRVHGSTAKTAKVRIVFTGKGGGRYLDVTRWLEESTRECYARQTADETLSVSWSLTWNATLVERDGRYGLRSQTRPKGTVEGSVDGTAVRDFCDEPDPDLEDIGPDWPSTTSCERSIGASSTGSLRRVELDGSRATILLRGPVYETPPGPCELSVRNDQLVASVATDQPAVRQLTGRGTVSILTGTRHPGHGVTYTPTQFCSAFPHIYEGIVYLYSCEDTLIWGGKITLTRLPG